MAIPRQVKKQIEEVEKLEKQLKAQEKSKLEAEGESSPEAEVEATADKKVDTESKVSSKSSSKTEKPDKEKPADDSKGTTGNETQPEEADYKQKYNTLQGKYNAEVPKLHQQIRELAEKLSVFEEANKAETEKPKEKVSYVTDADREEFGDELIEVQRRVAKEVAQEYEERLEKQDAVIRALQKEISNTGVRMGEMSFEQKLQALVPDFVQIDNDPRWVEWLNEFDPILRGPRRELAQSAFDKGDADAVADYVKLFKQQIAEVESDNRQTELEKQVTPNRSVTNGTKSSGKDAKVYTSKEMDNQWNKLRILSSNGKHDEAEKLEAELTAAYVDGRVRF